MSKKHFIALGSCLLSSAISASAVITNMTTVFTESFGDADGAAADRAITGSAAGSGQNLDVTGNVSFFNGGIRITPDGGSDRFELESAAGAVAGSYSFDYSRFVDTSATPVPIGTMGDMSSDNPSLFIQLVSGPERSAGTGAAAVPGFNDNLSLDALSTALGEPLDFVSIDYIFNTSGTSFSYLAPDGTTRTLDNNAFELFVNDSLSGGANQTNVTGAGTAPAAVDTIVLQVFADQARSVLTFDNFEFTEFTVVPEPSSSALLALGLGLGLSRRRRQ